MRVINAKRTSAITSPSKRSAKRAVLMALLVASSSTAVGQSPGMVQGHSHFQEQNSVPRLVRQGARITATPQVGNVQSNPFFSADETTFETRSSAGVQQNPLFMQPNAPAMADQPLIHGAQPKDWLPATGGAAVDRLAQEFSGPNRHPIAHNGSSTTQSTGPIPVQRIAMPLAFAPESAEPIRPTKNQNPDVAFGQGQLSQIDVSGNAFSRVIPVVDARDAHAAIQETQPIFFTLTDDGALDVQAIASEAEIAAAIDALQDQPAAPKVPEESDLASVDSQNEDARVPADEPESADKPESIDPAQLAEDHAVPPTATKADTKSGSALAQIDTPVKLAPVMRFAPDPSVAAASAAPAAVEHNATKETDELVVSKRTRLPIAGRSASGETPDDVETRNHAAAQATPIETDVALKPSNDSVPADSDVSIAIDEPTVRIERVDVPEMVVDSALQPLVQIAAPIHQLSDLPDHPQPINKLATEQQQLPVRSSRDAVEVTIPLPINPETVAQQRTDNESYHPTDALTRPEIEPMTEVAPPSDAPVALANVGPLIEKLGSDATPLIGSPLLQDPTKMAVSHPGPVNHKSIIQKSHGPSARLASSRHETIQESEPTAPKSIVRVGEPGISSATTAPMKSLNVPPDAVVLQLSRAQVRSMTIGGTLQDVTIDDTDICQAFASGSNQIKLIGVGSGRTAMTIRADVIDGQPARVQTFVIEVNEAVNATGSKVTGHTDLLNDSIDKAFPSASVVVSQRGGELIVTGHCDDEETAKQIIRMVRKTCLIPVQDQLSVR